MQPLPVGAHTPPGFDNRGWNAAAACCTTSRCSRTVPSPPPPASASPAIDELPFQRREETLRHWVVPTVAAPAHACGEAVRGEHVAIRRARVLDAAVRVMDQPG